MMEPSMRNIMILLSLSLSLSCFHIFVFSEPNYERRYLSVAWITPEIPPTIAPSAREDNQACNSIQPPENVKVVIIVPTAPATNALPNLNINVFANSLIDLV